MAKRESMMLAHTYNERKHFISGWCMSQKLDGMRCFWDGGVTRGVPVKEIPWSNTEKDYRRIDQDIRATGLWSRYWKPIMAPGEWLDQLPGGVVLDGELWSRFGWQFTSSVVKTQSGDKGWRNIRYYVFDSPSLLMAFRDGEINIPQFKKKICWDDVKAFLGGREVREARAFHLNLDYMKRRVEQNDVVRILKQERLPFNGEKVLNDRLLEVTSQGGEGLVLRNPDSIWIPERSWSLLKVKDVKDDEGTVVGFMGGKGKLRGLFGALVLDYKGKRLESSGFTNEERRMVRLNPSNGEYEDAEAPEGEELGQEWEGKYFKRGDIVSFKYRELSDGGIPKECRYWRKMV